MSKKDDEELKQVWAQTVAGRRRARKVTFMATAVALLGVAGCGGGKTYSKDATVACLAPLGTLETDEGQLDLLAEGAANGAAEAEIGGNRVTLAFERNASDASDTANAYELFGGSNETHGNAVLSWEHTPTDDERKAVVDCLA